MDSKLMRTTIVAVCAAILVVFAVVIGINWKQVSGGKGQTETTAAATPQDESETDDMVGTVIDMSQTPTVYGTQIGRLKSQQNGTGSLCSRRRSPMISSR